MDIFGVVCTIVDGGALRCLGFERGGLSMSRTTLAINVWEQYDGAVAGMDQQYTLGRVTCRLRACDDYLFGLRPFCVPYLWGNIRVEQANGRLSDSHSLD